MQANRSYTRRDRLALTLTAGVAARDACVQLLPHFTPRELGNAGEQLAMKLLAAHGYRASALPTNYPTYDIRVEGAREEFLVSVKTSREKQHVRLGVRPSVARLSRGNFVFAFLPLPGHPISLAPGGYRLLILPADAARQDSLRAHDAYWEARGGEKGFSVIVKAYDRRHSAIWTLWSQYENAWDQLP